MKKLFLFLVCSLIFSNEQVFAHYCHSNYLIHRDFYQEEIQFQNCDKHYALKETSIYYYSNGSRYTYVYNTIFNSDGSILESGCKNLKHYIKDGKHYFTFYKNKKYNLMNSDGKYLSVKKYKMMSEIKSDRLLVKLDKKFGIINLDGEVVVPIKYKSIKETAEDLYLTNLNGYYGFLDSSNNILIKNEYDSIKPIHNVFKLKIKGKFGLSNNKGVMILYPNCEYIKKLGEYILVKRGKEFGVFDSNGNTIADIKYLDVKFERNTLYVKDFEKKWKVLE